MTAEEALRELNGEFYEDCPDPDIQEALGIAIETLETIAELEKRGITIDTINEYKTFEDECVSKGFTFKSLLEAREKQITKKPIYSDYEEDDDGENLIPTKAECPTCGYEFEFGSWNEEENHHCICGQKMCFGDDI